jgi:Arc/MetJ-type ribon-helix-helix transcriptional regulator
MGVIQVQLPDELKATVDRQVAEGRAASDAEFLIEATRRYVEDLEAEGEIVAIAEDGNAALKRGDYVTIASPKDAEALHQRTMDRLRANLASEG